jgi:DNA mismatch repair protein MutS
VLRRAAEVLKELETKDKGVKTNPIVSKAARLQLTLFEAERHPVIDKIEDLDLAVLSPIEALNVLYQLQKEVKNPAP